MLSLTHLWPASDVVGQAVALLLLSMSVTVWALILGKAWQLYRARRDLKQATLAFWQASDLSSAQAAVAKQDPDQVLLPLIEAGLQQESVGTLATLAEPQAQLTRRLRDALQQVLARLQSGQVWLASVGVVSPFVGLFGTVWGVFHALQSISDTGSATLDQVAGPVGEALIMTAAGLAVAIPAVLAYNLFGKLIAACEADLEGFALDLRDTLSSSTQS